MLTDATGITEIHSHFIYYFKESYRVEQAPQIKTLQRTFQSILIAMIQKTMEIMSVLVSFIIVNHCVTITLAV